MLFTANFEGDCKPVNDEGAKKDFDNMKN